MSTLLHKFGGGGGNNYNYNKPILPSATVPTAAAGIPPSPVGTIPLISSTNLPSSSSSSFGAASSSSSSSSSTTTSSTTSTPPQRVAATNLPLNAGGQGCVIKFTNCQLYLRGQLVREDLWVRDGRVIDPASRFWEAASVSEFACDLIVDCKGHIVSPGFIDIQFNGAYGVDFSNSSVTEEEIHTVCTKLLATGVTSVCPTLVSSSNATYVSVLEVFRRLQAKKDACKTACVQSGKLVTHATTTSTSDYGVEGRLKIVIPPTIINTTTNLHVRPIPIAPASYASLCVGARIVGIHLEGPFIHPNRRGAHAESNLRIPDISAQQPPSTQTEVQAAATTTTAAALTAYTDGIANDTSSSPEEIISKGLTNLSRIYGPVSWHSGEIRIVTLAPELPGSLDCITALARTGVVASIGHTTAKIRIADEAVLRGASLITHLFNAMEAFHHRDPGVVGLIGRMPGGVVSTSKAVKKRSTTTTTASATAAGSDAGGLSSSINSGSSSRSNSAMSGLLIEAVSPSGGAVITATTTNSMSATTTTTTATNIDNTHMTGISSVPTSPLPSSINTKIHGANSGNTTTTGVARSSLARNSSNSSGSSSCGTSEMRTPPIAIATTAPSAGTTTTTTATTTTTTTTLANKNTANYFYAAAHARSTTGSPITAAAAMLSLVEPVTPFTPVPFKAPHLPRSTNTAYINASSRSHHHTVFGFMNGNAAAAAAAAVAVVGSDTEEAIRNSSMMSAFLEPPRIMARRSYSSGIDYDYTSSWANDGVGSGSNSFIDEISNTTAAGHFDGSVRDGYENAKKNTRKSGGGVNGEVEEGDNNNNDDDDISRTLARPTPLALSRNQMITAAPTVVAQTLQAIVLKNRDGGPATPVLDSHAAAAYAYRGPNTNNSSNSNSSAAAATITATGVNAHTNGMNTSSSAAATISSSSREEGRGRGRGDFFPSSPSSSSFLPHGHNGAVTTSVHERPYYGLIADGVHVHPYAVNIAYETHREGLVLVTDAMQAMGLPVGRHSLGENSVDIYHGKEDGHYEGLHAVISGTDTLAGAVVPLDECARNLLAFTGCPITHVLATVTSHPAAVLRVNGVIGSLSVGSWADIVILDNEFHVLQTWVGGQLAWKNT